jgi:hypothetical protein
VVDVLSATGAFSSDDNLECGGNFDARSLPFDVRAGGRFGACEGGSNSAVVSAASRSVRRNDSSGTRLGRIRPFGDDATSVGDGSAFFASKAAAATPCDARSNPACGNLVSDDCASGFDVVASLGRRRTSTVNKGTARLNVVLDTAHRSADSSRRRTILRGKAQQSNRRLSRKQTCQHRATGEPPRWKRTVSLTEFLLALGSPTSRCS